MRVAAYALLLCAGRISAQNATEPAKVAGLVKLLEPQPNEQPLACTVKVFKPVLNYAFQFESSVLFQAPLTQFSRTDSTWSALTEITPQDASPSPLYFLNKGTLEALFRADDQVVASFGYLLGEGHYRVRWLLVDDLGRTCRRKWQIQAGRNGKFVGMAPDKVTGLSLSQTAAQARSGPVTPLRITVLLDAAPLQVPRESPVRLHGQERALLFDGLAGLMERLPTSSARLIIFNLEQQKELLRKENFQLSELDQVARALKDLELGTVQLSVLEKPKGHVDLITSLLNAEIASPMPSDAVIILGPQERYFDKVPGAALEALRGNKPRFFSVQFIPPPRWLNVARTSDGEAAIILGEYRYGTPVPFTSGDFDTISTVIRRLKGKAIQVRTPEEFEKAIKAIEDVELNQRSGQNR